MLFLPMVTLFFFSRSSIPVTLYPAAAVSTVDLWICGPCSVLPRRRVYRINLEHPGLWSVYLYYLDNGMS